MQLPYDYEFTTDGCSGSIMCLLRIVWKIRFKLGQVSSPIPPWEKYCELHDAKYHPGGTYAERLQADIELMNAVKDLGYPRLGSSMFMGVRFGGSPWLPFPWRWGFAYKWWRFAGYSPKLKVQDASDH